MLTPLGFELNEFVLLFLAIFKLAIDYLINLNKLPMTQYLNQTFQGAGARLHKFGTFMAIGIVILNLPQVFIGLVKLFT